MRQFGISGGEIKVGVEKLGDLIPGDIVKWCDEPCLVMGYAGGDASDRNLVSLSDPDHVWANVGADTKLTVIGHFACTMADFE